MTIGGMQTLSGKETSDGQHPRRNRPGAQLEIGEQFAGRYTITELIGAGGMGMVYAAQDARTSQEVALKLIRPDRLQGPEAIAKLIAEGVTTRDIRHPNVIAVYDVDESNGQPFMSMERVRGQSLRAWTQKRLAAKKDCSVKTAAAIINALLDGLEAAHARGIVHRDLKPENVILTNEPSDQGVALKILDFGIAIAAGAQSSASSGATGTVGYMAPEQVTAPDTVGPSADLYSLSVILYELLVDVPPQGRWQAPSGGRSDVPPGLDALIEKGLSNRAKNRPQTVAEYRKALKDALGLSGLVDWKSINRDKINELVKPRFKVPAWVQWLVGGFFGLAILGAVLESIGIMPDSFDLNSNIDNSGSNYRPPAPTPPAFDPPRGLNYQQFGGFWDYDGTAGWSIRATRDGEIRGLGTGNLQGASMTGSFSGSQLEYVISVRGQGEVATGVGSFDGGCHINFRTFDLNGNLNLQGQLHVNHAAGAPCP
jgi:serine/threonine protein kinase